MLLFILSAVRIVKYRFSEPAVDLLVFYLAVAAPSLFMQLSSIKGLIGDLGEPVFLLEYELIKLIGKEMWSNLPPPSYSHRHCDFSRRCMSCRLMKSTFDRNTSYEAA